MEEEKEEKGDSTESGTTSTETDASTQNCSENTDEIQNLQEPEEVKAAESESCDGELEPSQLVDDQWISDEEILPQESVIATNTQDNADCLPSSPLQTSEEVTPPSVSSPPSSTKNRPSMPCWYCLRSLDSQYHPETHEQQEDSDPSPPVPSSGQKMSYQTDPRPHFGVAWSSHSTCRPLWGSEGPCWGKRNQEMPSSTHTCPHCHLSLPPDTLRWHEAKCLLFEGLRNKQANK